MRILLDECVPARLKAAFPGHTVRSVTETAWRSSTDKSILGFAQKHFDVFLTVDRNLEKQHDLGQLRLGFVVVHVPNNRLDAFQPILGELRAAVEAVRSGEVLHVRHPESEPDEAWAAEMFELTPLPAKSKTRGPFTLRNQC